MANSVATICALLLVSLLNAPEARSNSFSMHQVHPDNDAILNASNTKVDLSGYMKIELVEGDKKIALWARRQAEIDIHDLEKVSLGMDDPAPLASELGLDIGQDLQPYPVVVFSFTPLGSKKLAKFSARNVKRRTVVMLDGTPLAAPIMIEPLAGGALRLIPDWSKERTKQVVDRINAHIAKTRSQ